jgi:anti-anti-sigma factor
VEDHAVMPIERWSDSVVVVHLGDDPQFTDDLSPLDVAAPTRPHVVLDCAGVHFINSSNLGLLLRLRKLAITADRRLIMCNVQDPVWGTFLVTGLDKVFEFSSNVTTALATVQMEHP